jgi:adenylate kinase
MRIVITGVPGTGKTSVADLLGRMLKLRVIHLTEWAKKKKLGRREGKGLIVPPARLRRSLLDEKNVIIEGHLACEFSLPRAIVFVLRCEPPVLRRRLMAREYSGLKARENIEAEALDYCTILAERNYRRVYDIDATHSLAPKTAARIARIIKKGGRGDSVDWSGYFLD